MHASGSLRSSGRVDPFARAFADTWSQRMEEIEQSEPIWRDMHNVFRHFAVAHIIADRKVCREAGFDADFLLNRCEPTALACRPACPDSGGSRNSRIRRSRDRGSTRRRC